MKRTHFANRLRGWMATTLLGLLASMAPAAAPLSWIQDYTEGMRVAREAHRPVLIDFSAKWCGWCKVMDRETYADANVAALLTNHVCIKVDVDQDPDTAFAYRIGSLPRAILLDAEGHMIGDRIGYLPPDQFTAFVADATSSTPEDAPTAPGLERVKFIDKLEAIAATASTNASAVAELVGHLDHPDAAVREAARRSLAQIGAPAIPALVPKLGNDYLGMRIVAFELLKAIAGATPEFDPWAERPERAEALQKWAEWAAAREQANLATPAL